ncbi:MAG: hypothetical protein JST79_10085 [Acidobacteria bacterium]|jgi:hypothetical protein|nr:hypothetical protein [Acidobacteriota bacterium]
MATQTPLPIHARIERTERLLRMLEQDVPLLEMRFASLPPEQGRSARKYAAQLTAITRAELEKLQAENALAEALLWNPADPTPEAAD